MPNNNATVLYSFLQPHIIVCLVSPKKALYRSVKIHSNTYFTSRNKGYPDIKATGASYQLIRRYLVPLADSLIKYNIIKRELTI